MLLRVPLIATISLQPAVSGNDARLRVRNQLPLFPRRFPPNPGVPQPFPEPLWISDGLLPHGCRFRSTSSARLS